jgi:hypothetical protein
MPDEAAALHERIDAQKRILEIQLAILNRTEFVQDALEALASDEPGKDWEELKAELGLEL